MTNPKIVCVVPSIRPEKMEQFKKVWAALLEKHKVTLITVWDGESPSVVCEDYSSKKMSDDTVPAASGFGPVLTTEPFRSNSSLFYRFTDSCRNIGFVIAAQLMSSPDDVLITLDDDVEPCLKQPYLVNQLHPTLDPIQAHINALSRRVPISWMNTAHDTDLYLRGVPYGVRDESPVMLSHGVWVGTPDFDGETQLRLETGGLGMSDWGPTPPPGVPYSLPYFVGPIPKGVLFPVCGMNLAVKRDAIPYLYFAPMGPDSGVGPEYRASCPCCTSKDFNIYYKGTGRCSNCGEPVKVETVHTGLNRFADIWMGVYLKREFDRLGWACVTGYSTVLHTRASDAKKNFEQEKLGREWNEVLWQEWEGVPVVTGPDMLDYTRSYRLKRERFAGLIRGVTGGSK